MPMLKQCCATGSLHTGTPTGRVTKLHGLDVYVAEAPQSTQPKGIIVIIPDAFGWTLPNNRILADEYAKRGFLTYLPEFMDGFVVSPDVMVSMKALGAPGLLNQLFKVGHFLYLLTYFVPFMVRCRPSVAGPRIYDFLRAVKANEGMNLAIGTAGFCWGGLYVTKLVHDGPENRAKDGTRLTDAGFVAHPSNLNYPNDIENIVLPYSCAAAEHDMMMSPENAKVTKDILEAKTAKANDFGIEHEFVMYEGVHHGFAVRADEDALDEAAAGKKAEEQALGWFSRWFANPPQA